MDLNSTSSYRSSPLSKIILLSVILAVSFVLVILACIDGNWFPIIDGILFATSHLPVAITENFASGEDQDFSFDPVTSAKSIVIKETGQFTSAILVVTSFYLPIALLHSHLLTKLATVLTLTGGVMIFIAIYEFGAYFKYVEEDPESETRGTLIGPNLIICVSMYIIALFFIY